MTSDDPAATATDRGPIETLRTDPVLAPVVEEYGALALDTVENTFRRLLVSITRQQVSMDAAAAIEDRLFERVEPTPEAVVAADHETLTGAGLSGRKADYAKNIAEAYIDRDYSREYFAELSDDAVVAELTEITGVGEWTAQMFLMFALGREDVFPVGDLGIRKGMYELFEDDDLTRAEMREQATAWKPYRGYASLYVWRAYEG